MEKLECLLNQNKTKNDNLEIFTWGSTRSEKFGRENSLNKQIIYFFLWVWYIPGTDSASQISVQFLVPNTLLV